MAVYGITGTLFFGAITTTAGAGGTSIANIDARTHEIAVPTSYVRKRTGRSPDQVKSYFRGVQEFRMVIRARDVAAASINLIFQDIAVSGGIKPDGSGVTGAMVAAATTSLLIVPKDSTDDTIYIPNAALAPDNEIRILHSPINSYLEDQEVAFVADREATNTEPAWMRDTAANIAAAYAGLSS